MWFLLGRKLTNLSLFNPMTVLVLKFLSRQLLTRQTFRGETMLKWAWLAIAAVAALWYIKEKRPSLLSPASKDKPGTQNLGTIPALKINVPAGAMSTSAGTPPGASYQDTSSPFIPNYTGTDLDILNNIISPAPKDSVSLASGNPTGDFQQPGNFMKVNPQADYFDNTDLGPSVYSAVPGV